MWSNPIESTKWNKNNYLCFLTKGSWDMMYQYWSAEKSDSVSEEYELKLVKYMQHIYPYWHRTYNIRIPQTISTNYCIIHSLGCTYMYTSVGFSQTKLQKRLMERLFPTRVQINWKIFGTDALDWPVDSGLIYKAFVLAMRFLSTKDYRFC